MSTINTTDLMLINRANVDYKVSVADLKKAVAGVFTGPVAPAAPGNGMLWVDTSKAPPVLNIWDSAAGAGAWSEVGVKNTPPTATSLTVTDVAGGSRFTSVAFPVSLTMGNDGTPVSTKKLKAWVGGTLNVPLTTGAITSTTVNTGRTTTKASVVWSDTLAPISGAGALIDGNLGTEFQYAGGSTYQRHAVVLFDQPIAITSIRQAACGNVTSPAATPWLMINYLMPDGSSAGGISNAKPNEHGLPYTLNGTITNSAGTVPKTTVQGIGIVTNSGANPTMGVAGFEVNGVMVTSSFAVPGLQTTVATFASAAAVAGFKPGMAVTGSKSGARGVVTAISGATMTVAIDGAGTLQNGEVLNGPTVNTANAKLYCTLSATGVVTGMTSADPGFVSWTPAGSNPYTGTITFPATLPTGNAPDADFPAGATLTASAEASNTVGTVVATSTSITPA